MNEELEEKRKELDRKQEIINKLYERDGLTDEVLDAQVELNTLRHEHNISDNSHRINGNYLQ